MFCFALLYFALLCFALLCFAFFCCAGCGLRFLGLLACIATAFFLCSLSLPPPPPSLSSFSFPPLPPPSHFFPLMATAFGSASRHGRTDETDDAAMRCDTLRCDGIYHGATGRNGMGAFLVRFLSALPSALLFCNRRLGKGDGGWLGGRSAMRVESRGGLRLG
ncbi:uncharacterized protein IWZ02DRAFT_170292 [Phyllosticta citriasiana]|uniref:uncharacterized protein n=1 Tax=Phyllosticta citriasiana TaxID=595635 RepID=UPI0030FD2854